MVEKRGYLYMIKILLASPYGGIPGGISRWTGHIVDYYNRHGKSDCDLKIFPMQRSVFVNINSSMLYRLRWAVKDYSKLISLFRKEITSNHYDILHLTSSASISLLKDFIMLRMARRRGIKTIIHFRFGRIPELIEKNNWEWKLLKIVVKLADKVIVIDKASYNTLINTGFNNVILLPNPVAPAVLNIVASNSSIKREQGVVLFVGHVVKTKGIFELIEACKQIPNIKLRIVGHIETETRLKIEEVSNNAKWIEIVGEEPYDEVIKEMLRCDIFVLPTYTEGFPNVILESMACGCAIVASSVGAIPEMLKDDDGNSCGMLVKPQDANSLKNAILTYKYNPKLKISHGGNAKKCVEERYSLDIVWSRMIGIWNRTMRKEENLGIF